MGLLWGTRITRRHSGRAHSSFRRRNTGASSGRRHLVRALSRSLRSTIEHGPNLFNLVLGHRRKPSPKLVDDVSGYFFNTRFIFRLAITADISANITKTSARVASYYLRGLPPRIIITFLLDEFSVRSFGIRNVSIPSKRSTELGRIGQRLIVGLFTRQGSRNTTDRRCDSRSDCNHVLIGLLGLFIAIITKQLF